MQIYGCTLIENLEQGEGRIQSPKLADEAWELVNKQGKQTNLIKH